MDGQPDECDFCTNFWFTRNSSMNRTTLNCSVSCIFKSEIKCYQFWDEVIEDVQIYLQLNLMKVSLIIIYVIIFGIGLFGNFLVILAVCRNRHMRTVTNIFLLNLAISDFLVILICLPPTLIEDIWETWYIGLVLCKLIKFFQRVSVFVSVLTLTAIAIERFYAICYPLKIKSTVYRVRIGCLIIWLLAAATAAYDLLQFHLKKTFPECVNERYYYFVTCDVHDANGNKTYTRVTLILFFALPLLAMAYTYARVAVTLWQDIPGMAQNTNHFSERTSGKTSSQIIQRRRTAKMLIVIVVFFFICFFPVHLIMILRDEGLISMHGLSADAVTFIFLFNHALVYINSSSNPIIYNFMSEKFRREFKVTFSCCTRSKEDTYLSEANSYSTTVPRKNYLLAKYRYEPEASRNSRTVVTQIS